MEKEQFQKLVQAFIDNDNYDNARDLILSGCHVPQVIESAWDLIPHFCAPLTSEIASKNPKLIDICREVLLYIANTGNPKEVLLGLLEQADMFKDDVKFKILLPAIKTVLQRLPSKRHHSLDITIQTLYAHVATLELPEDYALEGEERKLLENDPVTARIIEIVTLFLDFLEPFVKEVSINAVKCPDQKLLSTREDLVRFLMKILDHPLVYVDLGHDGESAKSNGRLCAEKLVSLMAELQGDFYNTMVWMSEKNDVNAAKTQRRKREALLKQFDEDEDEVDNWEIDETIPVLGISCFSYLVLSENLAVDHFPSVFQNTFIFEQNLPLIVTLLKLTKNALISKGLALSSSLIMKISNHTLPIDVIDTMPFKEFIKYLCDITIRCSVSQSRQQAVKLLPLLLTKFEIRGRQKFLLYLFTTVDHSGLSGYVIQLLKEEVNSNLQLAIPNDCFITPQLDKFYKYIFTLPEGATTDMLDNSDKIMSALNLIRYLLLRDPVNKNKTGIWNRIAEMEKTFLEPLRTGLTLSRAHYQLEISNIREGKLQLAKTGVKQPNMSVSVGNQKLPTMPQEQQLQVLHMAIHTFDMMESVLARVGEIMESNRK